MYKLDDLNYLYQDLEPYIDTHTMGLHYNKHSKKYLKNLNNLLKENNFDFSISLEELAKNINNYNFENIDNILFNLGGVLNHNLYFKCISKIKREVDGVLKKDLIEKYGSIDDFVKEYVSLAMKLKGSGYTFLEFDNNSLVLRNRANQDSPFFNGSTPLFTVDLWEHAYYINYENDKERYLDNFFQIADFSYANKLYKELIKISN